MDTVTPLTLELNIALIPDSDLSQQLVSLSKHLASRHSAIVQLTLPKGRLAMAPHLTLYQVPLPLNDLHEAHQRLMVASSHTPGFALTATHYAYNQGEASFEVDYETTDPLVALQTEVIDSLNPLRGDLLLERDPAGNDMHDFLTKNDKQAEDVRRTGYWEVGDSRQGGFFRPHATLNWFTLDTIINPATEPLPDSTTLGGRFDTLGVFVLGPSGSCPQLLATYPLM